VSDPEEANSPGAENTEAVQEAHVEGASENNIPQMYSSATGYADAYEIYSELGWRGVLPLKPGTKYPPPSGFTGAGKPDPTREQLDSWAQSTTYRGGGLCLRLPDGVIGVDVDAYGAKTGAATVEEAEKRWGLLPPTVRSTSRDDGVSGIRLYKIPPGTKLVGGIKFAELGIGDIDIIQSHHRYLVCAPSIHPEGRPYKWFDEQTGDEVALPPSPEELPELPSAWMEASRADAAHSGTGPKPNAGAGSRSVVREPSYDVTEAMTGGPPSPKVATRMTQALHDLQLGVSRHDTMLSHVLALLRFGKNGQAGVELALRTLYRAFVDVVGQDRPRGEVEAGAEFARMVANANRVLAEPDSADTEQVEDAARAEAAFWAQRPVLTEIQRYAAVRRANPYAVLGAVLRRAIALVPPSVQLPAVIGGTASVNLFTASVGKSGQGKDIANAVAGSAVRFLNPDRSAIEDAPSPGLGSGEGLARFFLGHGNNDELAHVAANVEVNEVTTLISLADRKGGTLVGELLKAFTGQSIGFTNAQRATTTHVAAHTYRLCLGVSTQPENAGFFLDREKDGLPQRFLWLPIVNPFARPPCIGEQPEEAIPAEVVIPAFPTVLAGTPYLIGVPQSIRSQIENFRYLVEIGSEGVDPLDSHLMLLQLKVSFGLAALDERRDITEDDWRIAGQLIEVSNRVRAEMWKVVQDRQRRANSARAHAEADRQAILGERLALDSERRVAKAIQGKLKRVGRATKRQLQKSCTAAIRRDFDPVFDLLLETQVIVPCDDSDQYELVSG
jgi:hypothetical protein